MKECDSDEGFQTTAIEPALSSPFSHLKAQFSNQAGNFHASFEKMESDKNQKALKRYKEHNKKFEKAIKRVDLQQGLHDALQFMIKSDDAMLGSEAGSWLVSIFRDNDKPLFIFEMVITRTDCFNYDLVLPDSDSNTNSPQTIVWPLTL